MDAARNSRLFLHHSNRFELLADALAKDLAGDRGDPLQDRAVVVSSAETARWLSMQIATHSGLAMGIRYPFPRALVDELIAAMLGGEQRCSPRFGRDAISWWAYDTLPALLDRAEFAPIRSYLRDGAAIRRFELARRVASLFDQYQVYRPEMLRAWDRSEDHEDWQAALWRALRSDFPDDRSFVDLHAAIAALDDARLADLGLPQRVRLFGLNTIPPAFLDILWKASLVTRVDFYVLSPTAEYWSDMLTVKQRLRLSAPDDSHDGNPLALSLGRLGRELTDQLLARDFQREEEFFECPAGDSLLEHLQSDLLTLKDGTQQQDKPRICATDRSIEIHSVHGRMREIEVLHDHLLGLFQEDPSLRPRDVMVMAPDIDIYAPFIQAVFGTPECEAARIPYALADQSARSRIAVIDAFLCVLELGLSRFEATRVLAVLECEPVRRRFSLDETDLQRLRSWIAECGIVWGLDARHRERLGFEGSAGYSWADGLANLLSGYAMNGDGPRLFRDLLPYEDLEGDHLDTLQRVLEVLAVLREAATLLQAPRSRVDWATALCAFARSLFEKMPAVANDLRFLQQVIAELAGSDPASRLEPVPADVVLASLEHRLREMPGGGGFLDGRVTFCSLKPMRAIPARVICLLGMNDGEFPRQPSRLAFDRMAAEPRKGDRSLREDDRHLFLDALLGARSHLFISHTGQSYRDTAIAPPSSVVVELTDYLVAAFDLPDEVKQALAVRHPLQAFSRRYFIGGRLQSYSSVNAAAASRLELPAAGVHRLFTERLPEPSPEWRTVSPSRLVQFFAAPARRLGEWRLGISLQKPERGLDDHEPMQLHGLARFHLQQAMVDSSLRNAGLPIWEAAKARGRVPAGANGLVAEHDTRLVITAMVEEIHKTVDRSDGRSIALRETLGPWVLEGPIDGVHASKLLRYRCARLKAKDQLEAWIAHLLVNLVLPGTSTVVLDNAGATCRFRAPDTKDAAIEFVTNLLETYWRGLLEPLPLFPETSLAYVEAEQKGNSGFDAALTAWLPRQGGKRSQSGRTPSESEDPWNILLHGETLPFNEFFVVTAQTVFEPMIAHRETATT